MNHARAGWRKIYPAIALGFIAYLLNCVDLHVGWGLYLLFGSSLIYAFVRVLGGTAIAIAGSIASLRTVVLWNHPWAWAIWTLEAAFVARYSRRMSPVFAAVIYWFAIGTPLLALSYGVFMKMDTLSLLLTITKQATNGILNVVIGETLYLIFGLMMPRRLLKNLPKVPLGSVTTAITMGITMIPPVVFLHLDAPRRFSAMRDNANMDLRHDVDAIETTLSLWAASRSIMLISRANPSVPEVTPAEARSADVLTSDFCGIGIFLRDGAAAWSSSDLQCASREAAADVAARISPNLVTPVFLLLPPKPAQSAARLALAVPFQTNGEGGVIIAAIRPTPLADLIALAGHRRLEAVFIRDPTTEYIPLVNLDPARSATFLQRFIRSNVASGEARIVLGGSGASAPLMNDFRDSWIVLEQPINLLPGGTVIAATDLRAEVLGTRTEQLRLFAVLYVFTILVALLAARINLRSRTSLRRLALAAASLGWRGVRLEKIDGLIVEEFDEISGKLARAESKVWRQGRLLAAYQRRLDSLARHAPVVLYAHAVIGGKLGPMVFMGKL